MRSAPGDLSTKARIRDAAIRRFAQDGLQASLRTIAADAGVSPGLIMHHFGSSAGLRAACNEHVLAQVRSDRSELLGAQGGPGAMLTQLAQVEGYAPLIGYVLRCLQAGGALTAELVESLVADAVGYLEDGVRAGTIRPSRDPAARARVLTEMALGALLLQLPARQEHVDLDELPHWLRTYSERLILPFLELYTEPMLTDATLLDSYLAATDRSTS